MQAPGRLVTAEIDLSLYEQNLAAVRTLLSPNTKIMVVVKGNAYGHGIVQIAKKAEELHIDYFGVVCLHEARQLRTAGIATPILLLNYTDVSSIEEAVSLRLSLNVMDRDVLNKVSEVSEQKGVRTKVHVKIDSGMHRLGIMPDKAISFIEQVASTDHVALEGVFTHFAEADGDDLAFTQEQLVVFRRIIEGLRQKGITPPLIHAANSAATLRLPESHFSMVRPGMILYGPLPDASYILPFVSQQIMTLKTNVVQIRKIQKGESVGYGRSFIAHEEMTIAALPVGYADGFRRSPNFGEVLIGGKRVKLVGRVSMDQSSIDISKVDGVRVGDEVVILGKQGSEMIASQEIADRIGTINYEVLTSLSERVSRVYK